MKLFRPENPERLTRQEIRTFLTNFLLEARVVQFTDAELSRLTDRKVLGRLMDPSTQDFFLHHFGSLFHRAAAAIFATAMPSHSAPLVVELGCGSGSGSLLWSLLGARVVALDLDPVMISACCRRQAAYEAQFGRLDLTFEQADALNYDFAAFAPIDVVYSLFAFNLMQPSAQLLARILPTLASDGKIVISDGNSLSLYNRLFQPRAVIAPCRVRELLSTHAATCARPNQEAFRTVIEYDCIVPPVLARSRSGLALGSLIERTLDRIGVLRWLGLSYTLTAERYAR